MKRNTKALNWEFNFALAPNKQEKVAYIKAEELMDVIIEWAENNDCLVGGGFRNADNDSQPEPYPMLPED